jgi:hypothetical protein
VWGREYLLYGCSHPLNPPNGAPRALPDYMRRDTETGNVVVNGYAIGAVHGLPAFQQNGSARKRRHCKLCQQSTNSKKIELAEWCSGRGGARLCTWRQDNTYSGSSTCGSQVAFFFYLLFSFSFFCLSLEHINIGVED